MKHSFCIAVLIVASQTSVGQYKTTPCRDTFEVDIYYSGQFDENFLINDSLVKTIEIVFEQDFNDSVLILCGSKIIQQKWIVTKRPLGVSPDIIKVDYRKMANPLISIILKQQNDCISFKPIRGKRMAYINRINGAWSVELSNIIREYR